MRRRQPAAGLGVAEQHVGQRVGHLLAAEPRPAGSARGAVGPRHRRPATPALTTTTVSGLAASTPAHELVLRRRAGPSTRGRGPRSPTRRSCRPRARRASACRGGGRRPARAGRPAPAGRQPDLDAVRASPAPCSSTRRRTSTGSPAVELDARPRSPRCRGRSSRSPRGGGSATPSSTTSPSTSSAGAPGLDEREHVRAATRRRERAGARSENVVGAGPAAGAPKNSSRRGRVPALGLAVEVAAGEHSTSSPAAAERGERTAPSGGTCGRCRSPARATTSTPSPSARRSASSGVTR